eukprot:scaffold243473_cov26-Tisochrysis_lutea.AAC.5
MRASARPPQRTRPIQDMRHPVPAARAPQGIQGRNTSNWQMTPCAQRRWPCARAQRRAAAPSYSH